MSEPATEYTETDTENHLPTFQDIGLSAPLLKDLTRNGFITPTPIQLKALPPALKGCDVLGCAQTGTGKTFAFVIPMVERIAGSPSGPPRGLILAPTRELVFQIQETIDQLGKSMRVFATSIVGGSDMQAQLRGLRQRPEIIVATPGRLLDLMWQGAVDLAYVDLVVLDEADRMLDMGFAAQLNQIIDALPPERQTLLFSATVPTDLEDLVRMSLKDPVHALVSRPATPASGVTQTLHRTTQAGKTRLLLSLLEHSDDSVLIFTRTKSRADKLGETLVERGHRAAAIHGDLALGQRRRALEGFRRGRFRILVATDIAARGLDIENIGHVINYDLPYAPEDYVHRIGRTARRHAVGRATSFVTTEDSRSVKAIEKLLGRPIAHASHDANGTPRQGQSTTRGEAPSVDAAKSRKRRTKRFRSRRRTEPSQSI